MDFKNANELLTLCEEQNISISEVEKTIDYSDRISDLLSLDDGMDGYCCYDFIILKLGNLLSVEIDSGMYPEMQEFRKRED